MQYLSTPLTSGDDDFPGGSDGKESARNVGDLCFFLTWEDPQEKGMATHSSILAWKIPWTEDRGRLGYSPWVTKSRTRLSEKYSLGEQVSPGC